MKKLLKKIYFFSSFIIIFQLLLLAFLNHNVSAEENSTIPFSIDGTGCSELGPLLDKNYVTYAEFEENGTLRIFSDEKIYGIYLEWFERPDEYILSYNGIEAKGGKEHFLHEFIEITEGTNQVTFSFKNKSFLSNVYAYGKDSISENIQRWEPTCEKADILVCSTHADDEILFLGGVLAEYAGERKLDVQVLYFFDYTHTWRIREHEKLDGLWEAGVRHYPDMGDNKEASVYDINDCKQRYNYDQCVNWLVGKIRRYRPLVLVTQDENGEYGHLHHIMFVEAIKDAVNMSGDEKYLTEEDYEPFDVLKVYLHLYKYNPITLDTRKALENFSGMTAFDVAEKAYKKHVTQQEFWFYVSDSNEYSIAKFGLYRSLVGADTTNDMMENVIPYKEMKKQEEDISVEEVSPEESSEDECLQESMHENELSFNETEEPETLPVEYDDLSEKEKLSYSEYENQESISINSLITENNEKHKPDMVVVTLICIIILLSLIVMLLIRKK